MPRKDSIFVDTENFIHQINQPVIYSIKVKKQLPIQKIYEDVLMPALHHIPAHSVSLHLHL
jgi:hypothetical protein